MSPCPSAPAGVGAGAFPAFSRDLHPTKVMSYELKAPSPARAVLTTGLAMAPSPERFQDWKFPVFQVAEHQDSAFVPKTASVLPRAALSLLMPMPAWSVRLCSDTPVTAEPGTSLASCHPSCPCPSWVRLLSLSPRVRRGVQRGSAGLSLSVAGLLDQKSLGACCAVSARWELLVRQLREEQECQKTVQKNLLQLKVRHLGSCHSHAL